jgi:hypothetical protein
VFRTAVFRLSVFQQFSVFKESGRETSHAIALSLIHMHCDELDDLSKKPHQAVENKARRQYENGG